MGYKPKYNKQFLKSKGMAEKFDEGFLDLLKRKIRELLEWAKPVPSDSTALKVVKTFYKSLVLLLLLLLSPVLIIIMLFVFFVAL